MYIGAIADDLTGATDLALMLSREGMRVLQVVGVPAADLDTGDAEAVVVSLKSRTIAADEAVAMSLAAARFLLARGAGQLFFKYCSTFDSTDQGNIGPVTDALMDLLDTPRTLACPAFPANGRTVYRGHLFVGDDLLSDSSMKDHPLTPMPDPSLVRVLARQSRRPVSLIAHETVAAGPGALQAAFSALQGIAIVDAISDADLRSIGRAARDMRLITGGSGVALGLPANYLPPGRGAVTQMLAVAPGGTLLLAGSCSAATRRQVARAIAAGVPTLQIGAMDIAAGRVTVHSALAFVREHTGQAGSGALPPLISTSADPAAVTEVQARLGRSAAGALVEEFLADLALHAAAAGVNRFVVAGGETSGAVVQRLGLASLEIGPEIAPGVPWTRAHGPGRTVALALKSGNFGDDDFFLGAWGMLE